MSCPDLDLDFNLSIGFTGTDASVIAAAFAFAILVVAASSSSPADLSPITVVAAVVLLVVGAMDGRAAFRDPRPPAVSSSFSLRFSLRACDFEYGARDASSPVRPSPRHSHDHDHHRTSSNVIRFPVVMDHGATQIGRKPDVAYMHMAYGGLLVADE